MQSAVQKLREHYERLDTGELLEIAQKDLTDEAREALLAALGERGRAVMEASRRERLREEQAEAAMLRGLARRRDRLAAFAFDAAFSVFALGAAFYPLTLLSAETYTQVHITAGIGYMLERDAMRGQSFGKRIMGLRVIHADTGAPCTRIQSVFRNATLVLLHIDLLGIVRGYRMRLGDRLARTVVVRAEGN